MRLITVKDIEIGEGSPKIIVPIIEITAEAILEKAEIFKEMSFDLVEWRVDFYEDIFDLQKTLNLLKKLRIILENKLIIFTFRTKNEGGQKEISNDYYIELNTAIAKSQDADFVDIQIFMKGITAYDIIQKIHNEGCLVVGSNHNFQETLCKDIIVDRFIKIQDSGADLPKIAMMPNSIEDVLTILIASNEIKSKYADRPFMVTSMGNLGLISRLSGEVFGSSITFGAVGQSSAPGQIQVDELESILRTIHRTFSKF